MSSRPRMAVTLAIFLALALAIAGCAQTPAGGAAAPARTGVFPLTITDDADRSVTIESAPQRIVSISSSSTELVYAVGLQDKLVGVDDFSNYPPEAESKEKVGGFSKPNLEKIVSLSPDLILAANLHVKSVVPELEKRGLKVVVLQAETLDLVPDNLELIGEIGGSPELADKAAADYRARVEAVVTKVKGVSERPRVFFELDPALYTAGPDTFLDDMITKAGGENIAGDAPTAWPQLSQEAVVAKDPQIIVLADDLPDAGGVTPEVVKARPGWDVIDAVKNNRIVTVPNRDITSRPAPRAVEGLEFLAKTIHPDRFK